MKIIKVEDLRKPLGEMQIIDGEGYENCKFIGPGVLGLGQNQFVGTNFFNCGDAVTLPENLNISGVVLMKTCFFKNCEFHYITFLSSQKICDEFNALSKKNPIVEVGR